MSNKKIGGAAFPLSAANVGLQYGMTLRDYFAAKAMQGMLAASENYPTTELAMYAYQVSDDMLLEREK